MSTQRWLALPAFALISALALSASADAASEASFFDGLARRAYQKGDYESALQAFLLVRKIAPSQRALYNIAICA